MTSFILASGRAPPYPLQPRCQRLLRNSFSPSPDWKEGACAWPAADDEKNPEPCFTMTDSWPQAQQQPSARRFGILYALHSCYSVDWLLKYWRCGVKPPRPSLFSCLAQLVGIQFCRSGDQRSARIYLISCFGCGLKKKTTWPLRLRKV
jgi:hypothetical protein